MKQENFVPGIAVAIGSFGVVLTSIFYALSPVPSALPSPNVSMSEALQGMISGKLTMMLAGIIGVISDVILIAGALLLMTKPESSPVKKIGWALIAIGVLIFVFVDSLSAGVLTQLAALEDAAPSFAAFKLFFDICFIFGTITVGLGTTAILFGEINAESPILPKPLAWLGILFSVIGLIAALLYFAGISLPQVIGVSIAFTSLVFGIYGIRVTRVLTK